MGRNMVERRSCTLKIVPDGSKMPVSAPKNYLAGNAILFGSLLCQVIKARSVFLLRRMHNRASWPSCSGTVIYEVLTETGLSLAEALRPIRVHELQIYNLNTTSDVISKITVINNLWHS